MANTDLDREKISGFIVCYNEEDQIAECIDSMAFCDEIIVVDSFSKDRTVELAKERGAKVIQRAWSGYIDQKAFALENCSYEWIFSLDADERISPELRDNVLDVLRRAKQGGCEEAGFYINRVVYYLGRWWRRGGWYPEYRLRFFKKSLTKWGGVEPHDKPEVSGPTATLPGEIYHYTYDDMDEQFQRLHNYSTIAANEEFKMGTRASLSSLLLNPILRFLKFYFLKQGFREGMAGFIVAVSEAYYTFMKYAKLWEKEWKQGNQSARS